MALTPNEKAENEVQQSTSAQAGDNPTDASNDRDNTEAENMRRRILIGSQRDPAAYHARRNRDWEPVAEGGEAASAEQSAEAKEQVEAGTAEKIGENRKEVQKPPRAETKPEPRVFVPQSVLSEMLDEPELLPSLPSDNLPSAEPGSFPPPNIRQRLASEQEAEFEEAMAGASMDDLLAGGDATTTQEQLEVDSKHKAKIVIIRKDDVFVELGSREQGVISLQNFTEPPVIGGLIDVIVQKFNTEDSLYELALPGVTTHVEDWSDLREGTTVEAQITGHNAGGLECEVNHIRGFIPISQVTLYRVEDLAEFVGQHFTCLVTEANPDRRNLVLSRRAILEQEKAEAKQKTFASLQPGQIFDGVVRKLMDFGAFVEIGGGVDGLLHVSQLAWGRVKHPSEVVSEGQKIRVRIDKINPETGKISLAYRDLLESPWATVAEKFPPNTTVHGTVVKIMDFGAFVELEPGIEGLVHISELSHKRVFRTSDVVKEGQQIDVMVLSIDQTAQRISLSIKALHQPELTKKEKEQQEAAEAEAAAAAAEPTKPKKPEKELPLHGGLGKSTGAKFGLKW